MASFDFLSTSIGTTIFLISGLAQLILISIGDKRVYNVNENHYRVKGAFLGFSGAKGQKSLLIGPNIYVDLALFREATTTLTPEVTQVPIR